MRMVRTVITAVSIGLAAKATAQPVCLSAHLVEQSPVIFGTAGHFVAVSGNVAVLGAPGVGGGGSGPIGKAIVFEYVDAVGWVEVQELHPPDGEFGDGFGRMVAIDDDLIAASSWNEDPSASHLGSVYLFRKSARIWALEQKLFLVDGPDDSLAFGRSVAVDGNRIAVGATGGTSATGTLARAYIFEHDGAQWAQTHMIAKDDLPGTFGGSLRRLALSGDVLVGGSPFDESACPDDDPDYLKKYHTCMECSSGLAFVFRYDGALDEWVEEAVLKEQSPKCLQEFGRAVAVDGERVLIAAKAPPRVHVFEYDADAGSWTETAQMHAPSAPGLVMSQYGRDVDLLGDTALVGAGAGGGAYAGFGFIYQRVATGEWIQRKVVEPVPNVCCGNFGRSVALSEKWALVGAPLESGGGAAWVYDLQPPTGDLTCDDFVGVNDLLELLAAWGECPEPGEGISGCPGDLNGDGTVGVADLLILLANWG